MANVKGRTPLRSELATQTRHRILDAAADLFVQEGFAGTRVDDVAQRAGVAVPTVYKVFTNKRNLLVGAVSRAMTGGDTGAIDEQSWWTEQLDAADPDRQLDLVARNARRIYERAGAILDALRSAAPLDEDIAAAWQQITKARAARSRKTAKSLLAKAGARSRLGVEETALTLLSLTAPELYTAHIEARRTPVQYETWLAHVLRAALLR